MMHPEKCQLDEIQKGWLSAIIYFNMPDIFDFICAISGNRAR